MKQVSLQLVAIIDGKMIPIKTVDYSESVKHQVADGNIENTESDIVEYLTDEFMEGLTEI